MKTVHRKGTAVNVQITDADPVFRDLIFSVVVFYAHPAYMLEVNKAADFCACGRIFSCVIMENKHLFRDLIFSVVVFDAHPFSL